MDLITQNGLPIRLLGKVSLLQGMAHFLHVGDTSNPNKTHFLNDELIAAGHALPIDPTVYATSSVAAEFPNDNAMMAF